MALFTSRRERRLWLWALAVVVAIYSTPGLAGTLAAALRERNLLEPALMAGFILAIAAVVALARARRRFRERPGASG